MTTLQPINASASPEIQSNDNFETVSGIAFGGKRQPVTTGLTWGYYGGLYDGNTIADGTVTLSNNATNYIVVLRSTGVISCSTSSSNGANALYAKLYTVTTVSGVVTAVVDQRLDTNGLLIGVAGAPGAQDRTAVTSLSISSGVVDIDCSIGDYFTLALSADVTSVTFSNLPASGAGASLVILITQDATTAHALTWPSSFRWGGAAPAVSTSLSSINMLAITSFDQGTKWDATLSKDRV